MNIRNLCNRFVSSMLAVGIVGSLAGLGAHSVSAQSITVTTSFPYCVNSHAYPKGKYQFTLISQGLLSIRDVNGGSEKLFPVHPEFAGAHGLAGAPMGGLTFRAFQDVRELQAVYEPGSNLIFELIGQESPRENLKTRGSLKSTNCFTEESSIRGRNTTGR
jgi:hypothetical protein